MQTTVACYSPQLGENTHRLTNGSALGTVGVKSEASGRVIA